MRGSRFSIIVGTCPRYGLKRKFVNDISPHLYDDLTVLEGIAADDRYYYRLEGGQWHFIGKRKELLKTPKKKEEEDEEYDDVPTLPRKVDHNHKLEEYE